MTTRWCRNQQAIAQLKHPGSSTRIWRYRNRPCGTVSVWCWCMAYYNGNLVDGYTWETVLLLLMSAYSVLRCRFIAGWLFFRFCITSVPFVIDDLPFVPQKPINQSRTRISREPTSAWLCFQNSNPDSVPPHRVPCSGLKLHNSAAGIAILVPYTPDARLINPRPFASSPSNPRPQKQYYSHIIPAHVHEAWVHYPALAGSMTKDNTARRYAKF